MTRCAEQGVFPEGRFERQAPLFLVPCGRFCASLRPLRDSWLFPACVQRPLVALGAAFESFRRFPACSRVSGFGTCSVFVTFGGSHHAGCRLWRAEVRFGCRDARILPRGAVGISLGALFRSASRTVCCDPIPHLTMCLAVQNTPCSVHPVKGAGI